MIIWRGYGISVLVVLIVAGLAARGFAGDDNIRFMTCVGAMAAAIFAGAFTFWSKQQEQKTGVKRVDDLFFIPVFYWIFIMGALALYAPFMAETESERQKKLNKIEQMVKRDEIEKQAKIDAARDALPPGQRLAQDLQKRGLPAANVTLNANNELIAISFVGFQMTDDDFRRLTEFKSLEQIDLSNNQPNGMHISDLTDMPNLREARLDGWNLSAIASRLAAMPALKSVSLVSADVGGNALPILARSKSLESIDLTNAKLTSDRVESLAPLATLTSLKVGGASITPDELRRSIATFAGAVEVTGVGDGPLYSPKHAKFVEVAVAPRTRPIPTAPQSPKPVTPGPLTPVKPTPVAPEPTPVTPKPTPTTPSEIAAAHPAFKAPTNSGKRGGEYSSISYNSTPDIGDAQIEPVSKIPTLHTLQLKGSAVTDAGLAMLAGHPAMTTLNLDGTRITDAGMAHVAKIPNITTLDISNTAVGDAGLESLRAAATLTSLRVQGSKVTLAGVLALRRSNAKLAIAGIEPQLAASITGDPAWVKPAAVKFDANGEPVEITFDNTTAATNATLAVIARIPTLTKLTLREQAKITDDGLASLLPLTTLEDVDVTQSPIGDAGVRSLAKLPKLKALGLAGTKVSDTCLGGLARVTTLTSLDVSQTKISAEAIKRFTGVRTNVTVQNNPAAAVRPNTPRIAPPDPGKPIDTPALSDDLFQAEVRMGFSANKVRFAAQREKNKFPASLAAITTLKADERVDSWGDAYLYFGAGKTYDPFNKAKALLLATAKPHEGKRIVAYTNGEVETIDDAAFEKMKK